MMVLGTVTHELKFHYDLTVKHAVFFQCARMHEASKKLTHSRILPNIHHVMDPAKKFRFNARRIFASVHPGKLNTYIHCKHLDNKK